MRVGPKEIAQEPLMRYFGKAVKSTNVVERVKVGGQPPMRAENLVFHQRREGKIIKEIREHGPNIRRVVLAHTLVVKTVHLQYGKTHGLSSNV